MQLINFKRVQQELDLDMLRKYLPEEEAQLLNSCQAKMWNFDKP